MSKNSSVHFYLIYLGFNANVAAGRLCFEFGRRITHHDKKTQYTTRSLLIKTSPPPSSPPPPPSSPPPAANSNISVASQVQPGACQGVRGLDRGGVVLIKFHPHSTSSLAGDRGEAGDGGEGPGRLRDCPQGWSSSLPVSFNINYNNITSIPFKAPSSSRLCFIYQFQTHQRDLSGVGEEDQHNEGALQAEGEHRDVPQGLRRLRPQGARPLPGSSLHTKPCQTMPNHAHRCMPNQEQQRNIVHKTISFPGERLVRKQEPLYGGGQPLQPWWHGKHQDF